MSAGHNESARPDWLRAAYQRLRLDEVPLIGGGSIRSVAGFFELGDGLLEGSDEGEEIAEGDVDELDEVRRAHRPLVEEVDPGSEPLGHPVGERAAVGRGCSGLEVLHDASPSVGAGETPSVGGDRAAGGRSADSPAANPAALPRPSEKDLFPRLGKDDVCIYCGRPQTDEQAEHRTTEHIVADLLAVHRHDAALRRTFGQQHPGYEHDVYDLLCELDTAEQNTTGDCPLDGPCSICATLTPAARAALAEGLVTEAATR